MDMLPMRQHMMPLLEAVRNKNPNMAYAFKKEEVWKLLESLIQASSSGSGGTTSYPSSSSSNRAGAGGSSSNAMESSGIDGNTWTCNHCTFINSSELSSCEICSLPR
ncbi:nuclear protein localization protein 4 homolog [Musca vetustissima]|uniref:nuclear protein localization protein 4 homolog n=1 Tax=Musca vetustissima TaxID=27455 RepID=UPI002AB798D6|nr:nuclear protein localization protein 4 homolog [Musca vetustissima]